MIALQHKHNIIHRDIKAENVFYSGPQTVKVGDFGFSTQIANKEELLSTFCGSPPYAAPELFQDESYLGPYVDYWAMGVLLYFMVTAAMPFKAQTISSLKALILEGNYEIPDYVTHNCSAVIKGLLQHNPTDRLSLTSLRSSEWLNKESWPDNWPIYKMQSFASAHNSHLSAHEVDAYNQMKQLGINDELICDNIDKGSRSNVIGTFRIIIHRFVVNSHLPHNDVNTANGKQSNDNTLLRNNSQVDDTKRLKSSNSITKSIKPFKSLFIDKKHKNHTILENNVMLNNKVVNKKCCPKSKMRIVRAKTCIIL